MTMKISGFTIVRNAIQFNYPALESIQSLLPICDEFIVNVGKSQDGTLALIESLRSPKIRIFQTDWDFSEGNIELSRQTNMALQECRGDWAFYLQSDEVIHQTDLPKLRRCMEKYLHQDVDALRFAWLHFYGSYYRYRIDRGWYQKQDRIIRNNGSVESMGDAYGFKRCDDRPMRRQHTGCFLYHYGWVQPQDVMTQRRVNAEMMGITTLTESEKTQEYSFGDLNRFPVYFGSHPLVMQEKIARHAISQQDWQDIKRRNMFNPCTYLRPRFKTSRREKLRIH
ncbi:MAG: glycosyltransferase [Candidatus Omnitrophica bacterium]|nr:glycosyltransferase [Candidatus Omnitrophota bacterium]